MRLVNTETLQLTEETELKNAPPYAILSHTWNSNEVLFAEMSVEGDDGAHNRNGDARSQQATNTKYLGWAKIKGACRQARRDQMDYIWIDTCCINKLSSAVENEEINSMYRYYQQAQICYAYLAGLPPSGKDAYFPAAFGGHRWFTRGWTLQELIAPRRIDFFTDRRLPDGSADAEDWVFLGDKAKFGDVLAGTTGIDMDILTHARPVHSVSVAKRMSWATRRETKRPEDRAYSLIGLFDVSMPAIYGEGAERAFVRLQEEIMKESSDESLFAWRDPTADPKERSGLLAKSPDMFRDSGQFFGYYDWEARPPFFKTNHGLQITLPLRFLTVERKTAAAPTTTTIEHRIIAALNCAAPHRTDGFAGIVLERLTAYEARIDQQAAAANTGGYHEQYARVDLGYIHPVDKAEDRGDATTLYVRSSAPPPPVYPDHVLQLGQARNLAESGYKLFATMGQASTSFLRFNNAYWVPAQLTSAFTVHKEPGRLVAVVAFTQQPVDRAAAAAGMFTLLFGSLTDLGDLGVVLVRGFAPDRDWPRVFQTSGPRPCREGFEADLGPHLINVTVAERVVQNAKYFAVTVAIKNHPGILYGGAATLANVLPVERANARPGGRGLSFNLKSGMGSKRK